MDITSGDGKEIDYTNDLATYILYTIELSNFVNEMCILLTDVHLREAMF